MSSPMSVPINGYEPMNAYTLVNGYTDEHLIYFDLQWFAAEDEGRTEQPSEYKLRKAREEGRVAKSQELNGALVMLLPVLTLIVLSPWLFKKSIEIIRFYFERCTQAQLNGMLVRSFFHYFIAMVSPVCIAALIAGISANLIQNKGFMFSLKPIEPKFSKVLPHFGEYFRKRCFRLKALLTYSNRF